MSDETTKREETPTQTGNAAALREALGEILEQIDGWRTGGLMPHYQYSNLFDMAAAALAAPPRNCDLYATADEAMDAFDKFGCPNDCGDCPYEDDGEGEMAKYCQVNWLFATAAQEGDKA